MLSNFFKPAWQSHSVEKRIAAISAMDPADAESQKVLQSLAENDQDMSVRLAALPKITAANTLFSLQKNAGNTEFKDTARQLFLHSIGPKGSASETELETLAQTDASAAFDIAIYASYSNLRTNLLNKLSPTQRMQALEALNYGDSRALIANSLNNEDELVQARGILQGRDKNAERIIRSKIEAIRGAEREQKAQQEQAETVCAKMEYLSKHISSGDWRPEFKNRYVAASSQWGDFDFEPTPELQSRYSEAQTLVMHAYDNHQRKEQLSQQQQELSEAIISDSSQLASHSASTLTTAWEKADHIHQKHVAQWHILTAEHPPEPKANSDVKTALSLHSTLGKIVVALADIDLSNPPETDEDPSGKEHLKTLQSIALLTKNAPSNPRIQAKEELNDAISALQTKIGRINDQHKEQLNKLHKRIHRLFGSASRGELGRAKRELTAITHAAEAFSGKDRAGLDERITKASESLAKMGDWKDFVTEPKYLELCEAMEALVGDKRSPEAVAKDIKDIQSRWKSLGYSENSDTHWERFKSAGDNAYEPCAVFFGERKQTREANLKEREKIVDTAHSVLTETPWDEQPDYKNIEQRMSKMMSDWKKITDVEHHAGQKQWQRFSTIRTEITAKLTPVYDANIAQKHQLIEQAKALSEADLKEESLPRLQQLQTRWKQIGISRRKEDQAAWTLFKNATDAAYEKIQGARQNKRETENQQIDPFRDIARKITTLAAKANDLADADHQFEQLQADYSSLPKLPKELAEKLTEGLDKDYHRACDKYAKARDRLLNAASKKELHAFAEKARLCTELEKLSTLEASESEIQQLHADIDDIEIHDKRISKRFAKRVAMALEPNKTTATEQRRKLCIDVEILLGMESPEEDKAMRMQTQLERMKQQGIGSSPAEKQKILEQSRLDWFCLPGAAPDQQATLNERFERLLH